MDNNKQQQQQQQPMVETTNNYQPPPAPPLASAPAPAPAQPLDMKQAEDKFVSGASASYGKNSVLPDYGANASGVTPMQKEQQQIQQRQQEAKLSSRYPGVVGGTPDDARGISGYDAQGNPIIPTFIAQRHQIEQSLGPTCKDGEYHDLRMLLTTSSLLFAVLIIPYCCGYRGRRVCTCKKCNQKFPNIVLPSA